MYIPMYVYTHIESISGLSALSIASSNRHRPMRLVLGWPGCPGRKEGYLCSPWCCTLHTYLLSTYFVSKYWDHRESEDADAPSDTLVSYYSTLLLYPVHLGNSSVIMSIFNITLCPTTVHTIRCSALPAPPHPTTTQNGLAKFGFVSTLYQDLQAWMTSMILMLPIRARDP